MADSNPNRQILDVLTELVKMLKATKANHFRIKSFENAINIINRCPSKITSGRMAMALESSGKGIGKGTAERIDEILKTGTLAEIARDPVEVLKSQIIDRLQCCVGIGPVKALKYYNMGITGIDDLRTSIDNGMEVTHDVSIGVKYYEHFQQRINREAIEKIAVPMLDRVFPDTYTYTICGSYRRRLNTCGDIDIIFCAKNSDSDSDRYSGISKSILYTIVNKLKEYGFIVDDLTFDGNTKYMGVCKLDSLFARIDIRYIDKKDYPTALLYFTGSGDFNKRMRTIANRHGYTLNEYGLYYYNRGEKGDRVELTNYETEHEIFDILEMDYIEPHMRIM